jgi:hypothetical protein
VSLCVFRAPLQLVPHFDLFIVVLSLIRLRLVAAVSFSMNCICSFHEINLSVIGAAVICSCFFHMGLTSIALGANALFIFFILSDSSEPESESDFTRNENCH